MAARRRGLGVLGITRTRSVEGIELTIGISVAAWIGGHAPVAPAETTDAATSREDLGRSVHATRTAPVVDGALRTDLRITGDARARIEAQPREDAERNELTIVRIARTATLETCTQAELRSAAGAATATLSTRARPYLNAVEETLVIVTTASALELLGAEGAVIDACGTEIALGSGARAAIRTHLARFHSLVTSYGTASRAAPRDAPFVLPTQPPEEAPSAAPPSD